MIINIVNNILFTTTINVALTLLATTFGLGLLNRLLTNTNEGFKNQLTYIGSSYFFGLAIFLLLWRAIDLIIFGSAFLSLFITIIFTSSCIFFYFKDEFLSILTFIKQHYSKIFLSMVLIIFMVLLYWIQIDDQAIHGQQLYYFTRIGSLHTGDYALVSEYINKFNEIPTIRRNMTQMMLGSVSMLFGFGNAIFSLFQFLCFSIFFMSLFILGLIKFFTSSKKNTVIYFLIFALGSFSLGFTRIIIIDAGNPLIAYGYTDTIMANWFAIFSIFVIYFLTRDNKKLSLFETFIVFVLFSSNCLYGSQNLVLLIPLLITLFLFKQINLKQFIRFFSILILSLIVALTFGGLLTLEFFSTSTDLGARDSTHSLTQRIEMTTHSTITFVPTLIHYGLGKMGEWISNPYLFVLHSYANLGMFLPDEFTLKKTVYFIIHFISAMEIIFWNALRLIFWPLFAYVVSLILMKNIQTSKGSEIYKFIYISSFTIFLIAYFISFSLAYYGMKWELSRFMMGGMQMGMLFLVIIFDYLTGLHKKFTRYVFPILYICIIAGPVTHIFLRSYENLIRFINYEGFFKMAVKLMFTHTYLN